MRSIRSNRVRHWAGLPEVRTAEARAGDDEGGEDEDEEDEDEKDADDELEQLKGNDDEEFLLLAVPSTPPA